VHDDTFVVAEPNRKGRATIASSSAVPCARTTSIPLGTFLLYLDSIKARKDVLNSFLDARGCD